ncbi:MAG: 5-oxoprolinase subunit PxpA [Erysipelotrichaceae bacterium]|nr:5-oxoprolinase subunit PxpA [Erysipelotrichaceae bacterium]
MTPDKQPILSVDLNCDLGESFGAYTIGQDQALLECVTSANIACGWHAGDPIVMMQTVRLAKDSGTSIGAHPGYPDLMGFGRRNMALSPEEIRAYMIYQLGALDGFARANGMALHHVKPHGALYNTAAVDPSVADAIVEAIGAFNPNLTLLGLANSQMIRSAGALKLASAQEVFADRAYQADGTLVPRNQPGAVIHDTDAAISRVLRMVKEGLVTAITGENVAIQADSICVHGDNPKAVAFVREIKAALENEGIRLRPFGKLCEPDRE